MSLILFMTLQVDIHNTMMILDLIPFLLSFFLISYWKPLINDRCSFLFWNGVYFVPEQIHGQFFLNWLFAQSLISRLSHHSCCQEPEQTAGHPALKDAFGQALMPSVLHWAHVQTPERSNGRMLWSGSARGSPTSWPIGVADAFEMEKDRQSITDILTRSTDTASFAILGWFWLS